jgi:hypothetical protein
MCNHVHKIHKGKLYILEDMNWIYKGTELTKKYQNQFNRKVYAILIETTIGDITDQLISQVATFKEIMCINLLISYRYYTK